MDLVIILVLAAGSSIVVGYFGVLFEREAKKLENNIAISRIVSAVLFFPILEKSVDFFASFGSASECFRKTFAKAKVGILILAAIIYLILAFKNPSYLLLFIVAFIAWLIFQLRKHRDAINQSLYQSYFRNFQNILLKCYGYLALPGKLAILVLKNSFFKIRKIIRMHYLDVNISRGIIIIILLGSTIVMAKNKESDYELARDLGALVSAGTGILFAISSLHKKFHYDKRIRASKYIEEWRSQYMNTLKESANKIFKEEFFDHHPTPFNSDLFNKYYSILLELKKTPDGVAILAETQSKILERLENTDCEDDQKNVQAILDFFDHMGQDVKFDIADSDYLKDYFYSVAINFYEFFRKYIEYLQYDQNQRMKYCNFVYLAQTWEKDRFLPELPKISSRVLVITSRDLERVHSGKAKRNQQQNKNNQ